MTSIDLSLSGAVLDWFATPAARRCARSLGRVATPTEPAAIISAAYLAVASRERPLLGSDVVAAGRAQLRYAKQALLRAEWRHTRSDRRGEFASTGAEPAPDADSMQRRGLDGQRSESSDPGDAACARIMVQEFSSRVRLRATRSHDDSSLGDSALVAADCVLLQLAAIALGGGLLPPDATVKAPRVDDIEQEVAAAASVVDVRFRTEIASPATRKALSRLMAQARIVASDAMAA